MFPWENGHGRSLTKTVKNRELSHLLLVTSPGPGALGENGCELVFCQELATQPGRGAVEKEQGMQSQLQEQGNMLPPCRYGCNSPFCCSHMQFLSPKTGDGKG